MNDVRPQDRAVRAWLFAVATLVFLMIVVGGATRLTDSGLSITEWKPIMGAIPPLSAADWEEAFAKYREIPEYHHVNKGMSLDEFKAIFWWEWGHRFLGRMIGLAFAIPFALFWMKGALRPGFERRLAGILALGAMQGAIGWFMVMSGLSERVDVSQYRLALHLGVAFVIFGLLIWAAFDLGRPGTEPLPGALSAGQSRLASILVGLMLLQVVLGAFVAGLKAGLAYNTWPMMDGAIIPEGLFRDTPWWINFFENETLVQFNHRLVAYAVAAVAVAQFLSLRKTPDSGSAPVSAAVVLAAVLLQAVLGIATLLYAVPLGLGLVHQGGAAVVLACALWHWHLVRLRA